MRTQRMLTVSIMVAAALAIFGCSANDPGNATAGYMSIRNLLAPNGGIAASPDSVHNPPPPTPGPKQGLSLQFAGSDSASAGQSANTRWQFGNSGHSSISVDWELTNGQGWSGFPKQGTLTVAPLSSQLLTVAVAVPDTARTGPCRLDMTATPRHGAVVTAAGAVQVQNGTIPPDSTVIGLR